MTDPPLLVNIKSQLPKYVFVALGSAPLRELTPIRFSMWGGDPLAKAIVMTWVSPELLQEADANTARMITDDVFDQFCIDRSNESPHKKNFPKTGATSSLGT